MDNASLNTEYLSVIETLDGDIESRRYAARYMTHSSAIVHDEVTRCSAMPRLFDRETHDLFDTASRTLYGILEKVMQRYLDDPDYRKLFGFEKRLEELILIPRRYDSLLPVARVDLFLNEETGAFSFCEFNTDGSSGMNEDREVGNSIMGSAALSAFSEAHELEGCELFYSWVETLLSIYATVENRVTQPTVAICDVLEHATLPEFEEYRHAFMSYGIDCRIVDIRHLDYRDGTLYSDDGFPIDIVWRRCIYKDVLDNWEACTPLVNAMKSGDVACIGGFLSTVVHDKRIFRILHDSATLAFLSPDEQAFIADHIPYTAYLDSSHIDIDAAIAEKDRWVIKPTDDNGASDVFLGTMQSDDEWKQLVKRFADSASGRPFLIQEFVRPFATQILGPDMLDEKSGVFTAGTPVSYYNMSGLYLYDGEFAGVFSRLGPNDMICGPQGGITASTIWVDCHDDDDSECCGGHHHDDGDECCGGHHHDGECCGKHHHADEAC